MLAEGEGKEYNLGMTRCIKCEGILTGKQTTYCSRKCMRRYLKSLWQKRNRSTVNKAKAEWRKRTNRKSEQESNIKRSARAAVRRAIISGILQRNKCEVCGSAETQAHHKDYTKKLEVQWLCTTHHNEAHGIKVIQCKQWQKKTQRNGSALRN